MEKYPRVFKILACGLIRDKQAFVDKKLAKLSRQSKMREENILTTYKGGELDS